MSILVGNLEVLVYDPIENKCFFRIHTHHSSKSYVKGTY